MNSSLTQRRLAQSLWKIYQRPERPVAWTNGGNLPWNEPTFAKRMLKEHLDESHSAASRRTPERAMQVEWLWEHLQLAPGMKLLDITCGPGLYSVEFAKRGCEVTGIDFSPAAIEYARWLAQRENVVERCQFREEDVRAGDWGSGRFDAATFIYGQLSVFPKEETQMLLAKTAAALKPGGRLCVELLDQERVDKKNSTWWYTDNTGLWGDRPYLHLGERFWDTEQKLSLERFQILDLEQGKLSEVLLCDQSYAVEEMVAMMQQAGFGKVETFPHWDGKAIYDAQEWIVYVAYQG
ncbi:MAG: class I SAM-dependent methyltransferase [Caldilineaceae bacterium]